MIVFLNKISTIKGAYLCKHVTFTISTTSLVLVYLFRMFCLLKKDFY